MKGLKGRGLSAAYTSQNNDVDIAYGLLHIVLDRQMIVLKKRVKQVVCASPAFGWHYCEGSSNCVSVASPIGLNG